MSRNADIDALIARAQANPADVQAKAELWDAVVRLDAWFLLPVNKGDDIRPLVLDIDGNSMIAAFTDAARARDYARSLGRTEEEAQRVLQIPTAQMTQFFGAWLRGGAWGLAFNADDTAFMAPLASLETMLTLALSTLTDDDA